MHYNENELKTNIRMLENERDSLLTKTIELNDKIDELKYEMEDVEEDKEIVESELEELREKYEKSKRKYKRKITTIVEKFKIIENSFNKEKCSICLEVTGKKVVTNCRHVFHKECLDKCHSEECPMCRENIDLYLFSFESEATDWVNRVV